MTLHHPTPRALADHLRHIATLLDNHGTRALDLATLLAARGWPTTTSGDGSRSSDTTSSTERAAGVNQETKQPQPGHWDGVDERLHRQLHVLWASSLQAQTTITDITAHANDDDTLVAGAGPCLTCSHVCRPDDNPDDRLRSGLCPSCSRAWYRWRNDHQGDRAAFLIARLEQTKILEQRVRQRHRPGDTPLCQQRRASTA